jgi:hypothetical protein
MSQVQSVVFFRADGWTMGQMRSFLQRHRLRHVKFHATDTQFRFRIQEPWQFTRFITKRVMARQTARVKKPVLLVIGFTS